MATARTETTHWMARALGATAWQKGFICRCHYLRCHSQWKSLVTWTDLSNVHIDEGYKRWRECHLSVDTSYKAHGMLALCACSNHTHQAWHACWTMSDPLSVLCMSIDFVSDRIIYCGLRFYAQSQTDNSYVHATAPCSAHALTQARPTTPYIPLVSSSFGKFRTFWAEGSIQLHEYISCQVLNILWCHAMYSMHLNTSYHFIDTKWAEKCQNASDNLCSYSGLLYKFNLIPLFQGRDKNWRGATGIQSTHVSRNY